MLVIEAGDPHHEAVVAPATVADVALALRVGATRAATRSGGRGCGAAARPQDLVLLERVGVVDPMSIDSYRAHGGYQALRAAVAMGAAASSAR